MQSVTILRRVFAWSVRGLLVVSMAVVLLVALVLMVATVVLETSVGTKLALGRALSWYDANVMGSIGFDHIDGTLAHGATIHGLALSDRFGANIAHIDAVELSLDPFQVVLRGSELVRLGVHGGYLRWSSDETGPVLEDILPPAREQPPKPDIELDTPVRVHAAVSLSSFSLVGVTHGIDAAIVRDLGLELEIIGEGKHANLSLQRGRVDVPALGPNGLRVFDLSAHGGWTWPALRVDRAELDANAGWLQLWNIGFDLGTHAVSADVAASIDQGFAQSITSVHVPTDVRLALEADGDFHALGVQTKLTIPGLAAADVSLEGSLEPHVDLVGLLEATLVSQLGRSNERSHLWADVVTRGDELVIDTLASEARVALQGRSFDVDANTTIEGRTVSDASWNVAVTSLHDLVSTLESSGMLPADGPDMRDLAGSLSSSGTCMRANERTHCDADLSLDAFSGFGVRLSELDVSAGIGFGEPLVVDLRRLEARSRSAWLRSTAPATVMVAKRWFALNGLDLAFSGGFLRADAMIDRDHEVEAKLVAKFDLERARALAPELALDGDLHMHMSARGPARAPHLVFVARSESLRWRDHGLGDLDVHAEHTGMHTRVAVAAAGDVVRSLDARVDVPVSLDLHELKLHHHMHTGGSMAFAIDGLSLARLSTLVATATDLDGEVSASGTFAGRRALDNASVTVRAHGLRMSGERIGDRELGDVLVEANFRDERLFTALQWFTSSGGNMSMRALVPVAVNFGRPTIVWHRERRHTVSANSHGFELAQLDSWFPGLGVTGVLDATLDVHGIPRDPNVLVRVQGKQLAWRGVALGNVALTASYVDERAAASARGAGPLVRRLAFDAALPIGLGWDRTPVWHHTDSHHLSITFDHLALDQLSHIWPTLAATGHIGVHVLARGTANDPTLLAHLRSRNLGYRGRELGRTDVALTYEQAQVLAYAHIQRASNQRMDVSASIPVELDLPRRRVRWKRFDEHTFELVMAGIDEHTVSAIVAVPDQTSMRIDAYASAHGNIDDFSARVNVDASVGGKHDEPMPMNLRAQLTPTLQRASLIVGRDGAILRANAVMAARLSTAQFRTAPLQASLDMPGLALARLSPFLPRSLHDLRGTMKAQAAVRGTLSSPDAQGTVQLQNGSVTVVPLQARFRNIDVDLRLSDRVATLRALSFTSGRGHSHGSGWARIGSSPSDIRAHVSVRTDDLPLVRPGIPRMFVSTNASADVRRTNERTDVELVVGDTLVDLVGTNVPAPKRIPHSDAVTFVDPAGRSQLAHDLQEQADASDPRAFRLLVDLDKPIIVRGPNVELSLGGLLKVQSVGDVRRSNGRIRVNRGRFELLGTRFEIDRGSVVIPERGDPEPFVDVVARANVPAAEVTVTVRGRVSQPELRLSSNPPMSEGQIFSLLVTGSPDSKGLTSDEAQAKAASVLAAVSSPGLQRALSDRVGIDRATVRFGENVEQPILGVGKRLTKRAYVETIYHHNAPRNKNQAALRFEYQLARRSPRWFLETMFGDAAVGSIDVIWRKIFGGARTPTNGDERVKPTPTNRQRR